MEPTVLLGHVEVSAVRFRSIGRDTYHSTVARVKISQLFLKGMDFCGAYVGEVTGIEEQNDVFVPEVLVQ